MMVISYNYKISIFGIFPLNRPTAFFEIDKLSFLIEVI